MDYDFDDYNNDNVLSNNTWGDNHPVSLAQVDNLESHVNFNDPDEMFEFAIHDMDLSDINPD